MPLGELNSMLAFATEPPLVSPEAACVVTEPAQSSTAKADESRKRQA